MENTYGIGIANRYDLFYGQEDVTDSFETVITNKKKKEKAKEAAAVVAGAPVKAAEKENKVQAKPQPAQQPLKPQPPKDQKKGIKEQNNTGIRKDDTKQITQNGQTRPAFVQRTGENREERNNRKNRELNGNGQMANGTEGQTRAEGARTNATNNQNRQRKNFDGKRRDRQSGSDKTGVKAVDKRDGAGAHNWGTHKQDIEDMNKPPTDGEDTSGEKEGDETVEEQPAPEEPKEMTLDEWKAQRRAQMLQPQYNLRKAGEGENNKWDNMVQLDKKLDESLPSRKDEGRGNAEGKKKQVLDIDFHFNDGRRGGLGRRGPPGGGPGGERGGPGGDRGGPGRQQQQRRRPPRENNGGGAGPVENAGPTVGSAGGATGEGPKAPIDGQRDRRPRVRPAFPSRRPAEGQNAPKVDDERDFPSLG